MSDTATQLLGWFASRDRHVPGRDESDPYRVWVAEVMAQQTRIATVRPYYESFLSRFPDVASLASSSLDDVLKAWEGLGYYGRARNLHRAAREVMVRYGGRLPEDPDQLRSLPGVGPYTAGALASIAFGRPEPAVDGNVRRVMSRLHDIAQPTPAALDVLVRELIAVADGAAAELNQALMDLGSSVCTPRAPRCDRCPLTRHCDARRNGTFDERPAQSKRRPLTHHDVAAALVWRGPALLIARRPEHGLLAGLWEFPGGKVENGETPAEAARREVREELGVDAEVLSLADSVKHTYSYFRITLHFYRARWIAGGPDPWRAAGDGAAPAASPRWVRPAQLAGYAFPAANHGIIRRLLSGDERAPVNPSRASS